MGFNPRDVVTCLQEDLSGYQGSIDPWDSPRTAALKHMAANCTKKLVTVVSPDADKLAYAKFTKMNHHCEHYRLEIFSSWDEELVGLIKNELYEFLYPSGQPLVGSFQDLYDHANLGPGSNVGANSTNFYTKLFAGRLTATDRALHRAYTLSIANQPDWIIAEFNRSAQFGPVAIVKESKLSFVPKTNEISRTICSEPTLNMFFQLGLGNLLFRRLRSKYGLDVQTQQVANRRLALRGSEDGTLGTIDLSSASDTISTALVRELFPADFVSWLTCLRAKQCVSPFSEGPVRLHMISSMGNGYTFALQTLLFSAVVRAVYRQLEIPLERRITGDRNWGVYGDDIIVRSEAYDRVIHCLNLLGFFPNPDKSFNSGPFRESCGLDAFKGVDIRPVFCSELDTVARRYAYINRLLRWGSKFGIEMRNTVKYLLKSVPCLYVPGWENDDAGIQVPLTLVRELNLPRDNNGSRRYRRWVVQPRYITDNGRVLRVPRGVRRVPRNESGLLLAFLRGDLRDLRMGFREENPMYKSRSGIAPFWDLPDRDLTELGLERRSWESYVEDMLA